jgi:hypothetical protein
VNDRGVTRLAVGAVLSLVLMAYGFHAGGTTLYLVAAALTGFSALAFIQIKLSYVGIGAACGAAAFIPWNGWLLGHIRPGDMLIFLAFGCLVAASLHQPWPHLPRWVLLLAAGIIIVAALHEIWPTDANFLNSRTVVDTAGRPTQEIQSNLGVAGKYLVSVILIPLVFGLAAGLDRRAPRWIAISFATGASMSGLAGLSDSVLHTSIGAKLSRAVLRGARQPGFANHPNFLAATEVFTVAFALWLLASTNRRDRIIGALVLPGILGGVYASGSRGGTLCLMISMALCVVLIPRYRKHLPPITLGALVLAGIAFAVIPSLGKAVLKVTRLGAGGSDVQGSDLIRSLVHKQGGLDFRHSPFDGVGLQVAAEAHNVYLQTLAAGGLILAACFVLYLLGAMFAAFKLLPDESIAQPLLATLIAAAVFSAAENTLTDRFVYVPMGILVAVLSRRRLDAHLAAAAAEDADAALRNASPSVRASLNGRGERGTNGLGKAAPHEGLRVAPRTL